MKLDDTRITVFKEDYNPQRKEATKDTPANPGKVLYKKGCTYAIHRKVLEKIESRGAKFTTIDTKKFIDEVRAKRAKLKKAA